MQFQNSLILPCSGPSVISILVHQLAWSVFASGVSNGWFARLRGLGLSGRCFRLEHLNFCLGLSLGRFAAFLGFLQLRLYFRIELVDLLLEFGLAVGMRLRMFRLH